MYIPRLTEPALRWLRARGYPRPAQIVQHELYSAGIVTADAFAEPAVMPTLTPYGREIVNALNCED
jgi:hypothetical protein